MRNSSASEPTPDTDVNSVAQYAAHSAAFLTEIRAEFPRFRIVDKRHSTFSHCIDVALKLITLGGQRAYLTRYHTVIGDTLYVPYSWQTMGDLDRVILLRHERVHLRQRRRMSLFGMAFVYLVPWFPLGLAYGRARIEWEAYTETLRATAELQGLAALRSAELRERIIQRFTGPDYGWMWPFRRQVEVWYAKAVYEIETELAAGQPRTQVRSG